MLSTLLVLAAAFQEPLPVLELGRTLDGAVKEDSVIVETPFLLAERAKATVLGSPFLLRLEEARTVHVDLRSYTFDSYLVLLGPEGELLSEDDDGGLQQHARLVLEELVPGVDYRVLACALHGGRGPFVIELKEGRPPELTPDELRMAELEDFRAGIEVMQTIRGSDDPLLAEGLHVLGVRMKKYGRREEAQGYFKRSFEIRQRVLGPDHEQTIDTLERLAICSHETGDPATLIAVGPRAVEGLATLESGDGPRTATLLYLLANAYADELQWRTALDVFERTIAAYERNGRTQRIDFARIYLHRATAFQWLGRWDDAADSYQRSLELFEALPEPPRSEMAILLRGFGHSLWKQGRMEEGLATLARGVEESERWLAPEDPAITKVRNDYATMLAYHGRHAEALALREEDYARTRERHGEDDPRTLEKRLLMASMEWRIERAAAAREAFRELLPRLESAWGSGDARYGYLVSDYGTALLDQGEYAEARSLLERSVATQEARVGLNGEAVAEPLTQLGLVYAYQGLYREALDCMARVAAIREASYGPQHPVVAKSLYNLASALDSTGRTREALALFERTLSIYEAAFGEVNHSTALVCNALGKMHRNLGELEDADLRFRRGLTIAEQLGPTSDELAANLRHNIAANLASLGRAEEALVFLDQAIEDRRALLQPDHPDLASSRRARAFCLARTGRTEEALLDAETAMRSLHRHLSSSLWGLSEMERFRSLTTQSETLEVLLALSRLDGGERAVSAAYEALLAYKGIAGRLHSFSRDRLLSDLSGEQRAILDELRSVQSRLVGSAFEASRETTGVTGADEDLRARRNALELEWLELAARPADRAVPIEELLAALPPDALLLDFYVHGALDLSPDSDGGTGYEGGQRLSAFLLSGRSRRAHHIDLGSAARVEQAVQAYLAALVSEDRNALRGQPVEASASQAQDAARELQALLWTPLTAVIGRAATVYLSPDSFLAGLPFEALPRPAGGFLLQDHAFVYLQTASDLVRWEEAQGQLRDGLLVVGDVDYGATASASSTDRMEAAPRAVASELGPESLQEDWPAASQGRQPNERAGWRDGVLGSWNPLPGTRREAAVVRDIHRQRASETEDALVLLGDQSTEERVKAELARYGTLHLATHGYFQPDGIPTLGAAGRTDEGGALDFGGYPPGLLSGLVLAGANRLPEGGAEDGLLTAEEVAWLDLSGADLVVLSACETGLGRPQSGEGMIGLRRAFHLAGARTVVSSLWSVEDEATSELMQAFYRNLWERGQGKLEALRGAQLEMLERHLQRHGRALPSTWGAFVLSGQR